MGCIKDKDGGRRYLCLSAVFCPSGGWVTPMRPSRERRESPCRAPGMGSRVPWCERAAETSPIRLEDAEGPLAEVAARARHAAVND
jgi:hypothetical protein